MYPKYWIQAHGPKSNIAVAGPNSHTLSHLHHQQLLKSSFVITRFQNKKQTKKWTRGKYPVYYILFPSLTLTFSFYHHCNSVKKILSSQPNPPTHTQFLIFIELGRLSDQNKQVQIACLPSMAEARSDKTPTLSEVTVKFSSFVFQSNPIASLSLKQNIKLDLFCFRKFCAQLSLDFRFCAVDCNFNCFLLFVMRFFYVGQFSFLRK